ncbi:MAG: hypothetical protein HXS43_12250 [Theionarchaea archaeon]|nr:hypothetical protein [Theionarchaea archaeon]
MKAFALLLIFQVIACLVMITFMTWIKRKNWEKTPTTAQEKTVIVFILENIVDLRIILISIIIIFFLIGFILDRSDTVVWSFFISVEIYVLISFIFLWRLKKILSAKISIDEARIKRENIFTKSIVSIRKTKFLPFIPVLVAIIVYLVLNLVKHLSLLLSPHSEWQEEITPILLSLVGLSLVHGFLASLPFLDDLVNQTRRKNVIDSSDIVERNKQDESG